MMHIFPFKLYFKKWYIFVPILLASAVNVVSWLWLIIQIPKNNELVTLHYNILFGVDYVGALWKAYYVPTLGLSIIIINMILGWILYRKDAFMAKLFNFMSLFANIFIFFATYFLVYWNI